VFRHYRKTVFCRYKLPIFVSIRGGVTHFFQSLGNTTHFQNVLEETLFMTTARQVSVVGALVAALIVSIITCCIINFSTDQ